jgi:hypothetical protein
MKSKLGPSLKAAVAAPVVKVPKPVPADDEWELGGGVALGLPTDFPVDSDEDLKLMMQLAAAPIAFESPGRRRGACLCTPLAPRGAHLRANSSHTRRD